MSIEDKKDRALAALPFQPQAKYHPESWGDPFPEKYPETESQFSIQKLSTEKSCSVIPNYSHYIGCAEYLSKLVGPNGY